MALLGPGPSWLSAVGVLSRRERALCQIPLGHSPMIGAVSVGELLWVSSQGGNHLALQGHSGVSSNWKVWGMLALELILKQDIILIQVASI